MIAELKLWNNSYSRFDNVGCDENVNLAILTSKIQEIAVNVSDTLIPISIVLYITFTTIYI